MKQPQRFLKVPIKWYRNPRGARSSVIGGVQAEIYLERKLIEIRRQYGSTRCVWFSELRSRDMIKRATECLLEVLTENMV